MSTTEVKLDTSPPAVPAEFRPRLRLGFGLCCVGLTLAVCLELGAQLVPALAAAPGGDASKLDSPPVNFGLALTHLALQAVLVAGWVCLYIAPVGSRWRATSMALLAMGGADVAMMIMNLAGADPFAVAVARRLGMALVWIELWLIAVLAADAAEAVERSDITYQTEITGLVIVFGAFAWLGAEIWGFNPVEWSQPSAAATPDTIGFVLIVATMILSVVVFVRTAVFSGQLAAALSPGGNELPPSDAAA